MNKPTEWRFGKTDDLPEGPWKSEPDKVSWIDDATGLDCLIVRGPVNALCGYVGVPPAHPWHGLNYGSNLPCCTCGDDCHEYAHTIEGAIRVHGGLTFSGLCNDDDPDGICHVPRPGRPANVKWFGFDCAHAGDLTPYRDGHGIRMYPEDSYRDVAYVTAECASLAEQLARVS